MRITNTTTFDRELIAEIARFVCPPGVTGYDVHVGHMAGSSYKGVAYPEGHGSHGRACWFVKLHLGKTMKFPKPPRLPHRAGYLPTPWLADRTEVLVYLAAHELRHLWQGKVPRGRRVWGARGQYSERDADAYAIRMLRAWRRR